MRTSPLIRAASLAATAIVSLALAADAQPARRAITLDDLATFKTVGDPQRSPDGKWVAYTVTTVNV